MSIQHAQSGEVIQLTLGAALSSSRTTTIVKSDNLEMIRLLLPAGKEIPTHRAPGEITVQCLEGRVAFTVGSVTQEIAAGQLLYLAAAAPHSVKAVEPSSLLLTLFVPNTSFKEPFDVVQEASEESFPASDAPAY